MASTNPDPQPDPQPEPQPEPKPRPHAPRRTSPATGRGPAGPCRGPRHRPRSRRGAPRPGPRAVPHLGGGERERPQPGGRRRPDPHGPEHGAGPRRHRGGQPVLGPDRSARRLGARLGHAERGDRAGGVRHPRQPGEHRPQRLDAVHLLHRPQPGRRRGRRLRPRGKGGHRHQQRRQDRRRGRHRRPHPGHRRLRARHHGEALPPDRDGPHGHLRRRRRLRPRTRRPRPPARRTTDRRRPVGGPHGRRHAHRLGPALVHQQRRLLPLPAAGDLPEGRRGLDRTRRIPARRPPRLAGRPRSDRRGHERPAVRAGASCPSGSRPCSCSRSCSAPSPTTP